MGLGGGGGGQRESCTDVAARRLEVPLGLLWKLLSASGGGGVLVSSEHPEPWPVPKNSHGCVPHGEAAVEPPALLQDALLWLGVLARLPLGARGAGRS